MSIECRITLDDDYQLNCLIELGRSNQSAAVDLCSVIGAFQRLSAFQQVAVSGRTPECESAKLSGLAEGLWALLGVIMATNACLVLNKLRPQFQLHLPFANVQDATQRAAFVYLTPQYFIQREGGEAGRPLKGLVCMFQQPQKMNQVFWQRLHDICEGASNFKAFLSFFLMASSLSCSLETQRQKIHPLIIFAGE